MPAQLVALNDGPSILVDKPILLVGRHPECDIQIDSRKISRRHCCIAQVHDYLVVRDLPVPLPDPGRPIPGSTRPPMSPGVHEDDESLVIPENLELMPNSGSYPGATRPPGAQS